MSAGKRQVDLATEFDIATILNENNKTLKLLRCLRHDDQDVSREETIVSWRQTIK